MTTMTTKCKFFNYPLHCVVNSKPPLINNKYPHMKQETSEGFWQEISVFFILSLYVTSKGRSSNNWWGYSCKKLLQWKAGWMLKFAWYGIIMLNRYMKKKVRVVSIRRICSPKNNCLLFPNNHMADWLLQEVRQK